MPQVSKNAGLSKFFCLYPNWCLFSRPTLAPGKIVEELERQGVLDETLVIFTTDNGLFQSERKRLYMHFSDSLNPPVFQQF